MPASIPGAILAGGRSIRFGGFPKGRLRPADCRSNLARLTAEARKAGVLHLTIVANEPDAYSGEGLPTIPDLRRGLGPLAGIEAALHHWRDAAGVLVLPCDLPGLTSAEIAELLAAFQKRNGRLVAARTGQERWHPLCAVVPMVLRGAVGAALDRLHLSVHRLWTELGVAPVDFKPGPAFTNINTPEDWSAFQAQGAGRGSHPAMDASPGSGS